MFGILDRLYARSKRRVTREEVDWKPQINVYDNSDETYYCFVPKIVMGNDKIGAGILPENGKVIAYTTSYINLVVPDAEKTRNNLRAIYYNALAKINDDIKEGRKISVLGVSIGNVLSFRCAGNVPMGRIANLISIVGGSHLGFSAWDSVATSRTAQNSGCTNVEEYENILSEFAPIKYAGDIHAKRIFARFGSSDLMIRYKPHGRKLEEALNSMDAPHKNIKTYRWADHSSAILRASREGIHDNLK